MIHVVDPKQGPTSPELEMVAGVRQESRQSLEQRIAALEEENREMRFLLYGGRDEGDKGVIRWLRFYEEIASIWAYEARKSREAIMQLLEERNAQR